MFEWEVVFELAVGGVVVGEDAPHCQEQVDGATAWIAEDRAEGSDATECEPRRGDERVGVQDTGQNDVEEEALGSILLSGEVTVVEVGRDDACVVRSVQVCAVGSLMKAVQSSTVSVEGEPLRPVARPKASQLSRRSRSLSPATTCCPAACCQAREHASPCHPVREGQGSSPEPLAR